MAQEPISANEKTIDEFRDIMNIRKKYMNLLGGGTSGSNELSSSQKFQMSGGSAKKDSTGKFDGSGSRKKPPVVNESIDNLLHTLKSSKKLNKQQNDNYRDGFVGVGQGLP